MTLLSRRIRGEEIARLTEIVARHGLNIDKINRLSGRVSPDAAAESDRACVEFSVRGDLADAAAVRRDFLELASELDVDIAYQEDNMFRRTRRLVAFDMDSTLIEAEVIDELAKRAGVGAEVAAITERAMRGEIDFSESFRQRVALLAGLDESVLEEVAAQLRLSEGAEKLIATLRRIGFRTAIISGGFGFFGRRLQQRLGTQRLFQRVALGGQFRLFAADLHLLQFREVAQLQLQDGLGLLVAQPEARHQGRLGLVLVADDRDHLVDVEEGDQQAVEDVQAAQHLVQPVPVSYTHLTLPTSDLV